MSLTILLYKDTPFDNVAESVPEWLTHILFCDGKAIQGELHHCTFNVEGQPPELYGYLVNINDEQLTTPNLWLMHLDAGNADNPSFGRLANLLSAVTQADLLNVYMSGTHAVVEYKGGAVGIRNNFAAANRKAFGVIE